MTNEKNESESGEKNKKSNPLVAVLTSFNSDDDDDPLCLQSLEKSSIIVGESEIQTWRDEDCHGKIRSAMGIADDFLKGNVNSDAFKPGGGKGGQLMAFSKCKRFIVKEMDEGDHQSLLSVSDAYRDHVLGGPSLLCLYLLHYRDVATDKIFIVMANSCARTPLPGFENGMQYDSVYDLKGCADDKTLTDMGKSIKAVHKRVWQVHMWMGHVAWSDERTKYYNGKVEAQNMKQSIPAGMHQDLSKAATRDVREFLIPCNLMDYSLLLGIRTIELSSDEQDTEAWSKTEIQSLQKNGPLSSLKNWQTPFVWMKGAGRGHNRRIKILAMGIIDLLQDWTISKELARFVKAAERNKATIPPKEYGERFIENFFKWCQPERDPSRLSVVVLDAVNPLGLKYVQNSPIVVGDRKIETWNDFSCYSIIRRAAGVSDDFLKGNVNHDAFKSGGGKGGQLMAFSTCKRFIIKEMNEGDHESLLHITDRYRDHILDGPTLLCLYLLHYKDIATGKIFIVMANSLARMPLPGFKDGSQYDSVYDLKGCDDDKTLKDMGKSVRAAHKRVWQVHMWMGKVAWSDTRKNYYKGKVEARNMKRNIPGDLQHDLEKVVTRDVTEFLIPCELMDYSLLLGIRTIDLNADGDDVDAPSMGEIVKIQQNSPLLSLANWQYPFIWTKGAELPGDKPMQIKVMAMGIIDLLQDWNKAKELAMFIKIAERNKATIPPKDYGERFVEQFRERCRPNQDQVLEYKLPEFRDLLQEAEELPLMGDGNDVFYSARSEIGDSFI